MSNDRELETPAAAVCGIVTARDLTREAAGHLAELARIVRDIEELLGLAPGKAFVPRQYGGEGKLDAPAELAHTDLTARLTQREREVLTLLVQGMSNRLIARALRIVEPTVKNHLHAIFLKLGVADRTQAIAKVLRGR